MPDTYRPPLREVDLNDKFDLTKDRVFISGTQALIRLCLMQAQRDKSAGLNTRGYVTGYRGSPLGALDQQFGRAGKLLGGAGVVFEPGLNEDLAATAVWGSQQAELHGEGAQDGVFAMWYGKGPGVDRSGDVLRHGNLSGSSRHGGVLVLMGDDHTCESSTTAHQSEFALVDAMMPVLNPATLRELVEFGLHGWAMSRYSGLWCGLKCVKDNVESTGSVDMAPEGFRSVLPAGHDLPDGGLNIRRGDTPLIQEARLHQHKIAAAQAFARANGLDRVVRSGGDAARIGIISAGKSFLDTQDALGLLGAGAEDGDSGLALYKVGMTWPLEPEGLRRFARGKDLLIVVEEKRGLIEDQVRSLLYGEPGAPVIIGKKDETGAVLFQAEGALDPVQIARAIGARAPCPALKQALDHLPDGKAGGTELGVARTPYFCAGCPHNTSTRLPDGARGYAGIGCHWMAQSMGRNVEGYTHMGGEGANWIGEARFSTRKHIFQNLGDGTYNHSGLMAIRAAIDSGVNITFKILYNDAVAMTGGQTHEGGMDLYRIAREVMAAGAREIVVVSDRPDLLDKTRLPANTRLSPREDLLEVENRLSKVEGCSILIYEQTCAAEKRRRRKRGKMEDPPKRIFINPRVCEGCGDCGVQSNCVAILPEETPWGRKRRIDQSACNKDYSCIKGFCPSFSTVDSALRKPKAQDVRLTDPPEPERSELSDVYSVVLTGVGGTGVVTIGALLGMAAHIEGKGCGIIDMAGLAQKGGAVTSHIKLAPSQEAIGAIRIAPGGADLVLGCDLLVSAGDTLMKTVATGRTQAVVNTAEVMTGAFTRDPDFKLPVPMMEFRLRRALGDGAAHMVDATRLAESLLGDSIGANLFLLGVAYQKGLVPLSSEAILRAIALNGVAVAFNTDAFRLGRCWAHDAAMVEVLVPRAPDPANETLDDMIARCTADLGDYQDKRYAARYADLAMYVITVDPDPEQRLSRAVARYAHKLMAYKDEYEVARLYSQPEFRASLAAQFEDPGKIRLHLAPPGLTRKDPATGRPRKMAFGPWIFPVLRGLSRLRKLRGSWADPFGRTAERRKERQIAADYLSRMAGVAESLSPDTYDLWVEIAELPEKLRGFGPVKEGNIQRYEAELATLLAKLTAQARRPRRESA